MTDDEYREASEMLSVDSIFDCDDYNDICAAVWSVTARQELRDALDDQC